ncbi:MAG TPA: rhodanese-like domain-containing protein [Terriglobales bacterium]|nr:rhodanese-like domain-containing protein [Terriglobales bacterium]
MRQRREVPDILLAPPNGILAVGYVNRTLKNWIVGKVQNQICQTDSQLQIILDLRPDSDLEVEPLLIRGARHIALDELPLRHGEIPRDRDVVLYCSCPNEESSARAALLLRRNGMVRVHPLLGGFGAWREHNYPTESRVAQASIASIASTFAP